MLILHLGGPLHGQFKEWPNNGDRHRAYNIIGRSDRRFTNLASFDPREVAARARCVYYWIEYLFADTPVAFCSPNSINHTLTTPPEIDPDVELEMLHERIDELERRRRNEPGIVATAISRATDWARWLTPWIRADAPETDPVMESEQRRILDLMMSVSVANAGSAATTYPEGEDDLTHAMPDDPSLDPESWRELKRAQRRALGR